MELSDIEKEQEFSKRVQKETLIRLVEMRPVLWDKNLDIYKDKAAKATAWREICIILMHDYEEMETKYRHEFGKFVIKKWSQTRDAWIRTLKEEKKCKKSGVPSKPYRYHEQMMFLKRVVLTGDPNGSSSSTTRNEVIVNNEHNSADSDERPKINIDLESACNSNQHQPPPIKKRKINEVDEKMKSFIDYHNAKRASTYTPSEDRNLTFFKSLLPSLALIDDDQTLEFQSGVLSLLQSIKRRPPYCEWRNQSLGYFRPRVDDICESPSATSMSTHSQSSEVQDPPFLVKVEIE